MFYFFLPASVVPLDMDEVRDSVVLGRFNPVSLLAASVAEGGPEGLGVRNRKDQNNETNDQFKTGSWRKEVNGFLFLLSSPPSTTWDANLYNDCCYKLTDLKWGTHSTQCLGEVLLW